MQILPELSVLVVLAGLIPSLSLPYFRGMKITGVNGSPYHTNLLTTSVGVIAGTSVIFTLGGFLYRVLLLGTAPVYYHYSILAMVGLSLFYAAGNFLGVQKAGKMAAKAISKIDTSKGIFPGSVTVG